MKNPFERLMRRDIHTRNKRGGHWLPMRREDWPSARDRGIWSAMDCYLFDTNVLRK